MSDAPTPFAFSQFVPGFDFLKNLAGAVPPGAASGAGPGGAPGMPGMSSFSKWVAPTLSVEEVDKRIQELKTVQYWLEQNGHALKATIQALEVQKMTLSTLRGMNVQMDDLAKMFVPVAPAADAPAAAAAPAAASARPPESAPAPPSKDEAAAPGGVDPVAWWNALTQQFQQIASTAMQEAAQIPMPPMAPAATDRPSKQSAPAAKTRTAGARKTTAAERPARKTAATPRPRSR